MSINQQEHMCLTKKGEFSIHHTNVTKGVACLLLLFHHLFSNALNKMDIYSTMGFFRGEPIEGFIAAFCKVCVAVFLLLSGYGINETFNKRINVNPGNETYTVFRTCLRLLWKLYMGYWIIYILFVPWQGLYGREPYLSFVDGIIDFFGLAFLFNTPTMNATWWYMSVVIFSYIIAPFFKCIIRKYVALKVVIVFLFFVLFGTFGSVFWSALFLLGMCLSEDRFFEKISERQCSKIYKWSLCAALVVISAVLRYLLPIWTDAIFALSIIIFSYFCISEITWLTKILSFIGRHSANIFMFHTFIYNYNFETYIYAARYAPFILIWLTVICLVISVVIEGIKRVTHFQHGIDYIGKKIEGTTGTF